MRGVFLSKVVITKTGEYALSFYFVSECPSPWFWFTIKESRLASAFSLARMVLPNKGQPFENIGVEPGADLDSLEWLSFFVSAHFTEEECYC